VIREAHAWLVTRYDLAVAVMRDAETFTVDDPRFSTAQVIGPSMLSLDAAEHDRHRAPFVGPFRPAAVHDQFAAAVAADANRFIERLEANGRAELRGSFAGPLAAATIGHALGIEDTDSLRAWYAAIVSAVNEITEGNEVPVAGREAFGALREALRDSPQLATVGAGSELSSDQLASDAAVLLFGGIETMEGMICNAVLLLLENAPALNEVREHPELLDAAIEESLRLEPAAAVIDRYATRDVELAGARIAKGDLVRVSIAAANRDPAVFPDPDQFELQRGNQRRHLAFAQGPHVCLGVHLARLEARTALKALLDRLHNLRLDRERPSSISGLVFRKPAELNVVWDA
jgi:cytochrome P450